MATPGSHCRKRTNRWNWIPVLASIGLFSASSPTASAQTPADENARWQFSIAAVLPTSYANDHVPAGLELDLSYRLSRRVGVGLTGLQHDYEEEYQFDYFAETGTTLTTYRPVWLLARTDFHFTPDRRVDLIFSPMVGVVRTGDIRLETYVEYPFGLDSSTRLETQEDMAWGARLALDIPLGRRPAAPPSPSA